MYSDLFKSLNVGIYRTHIIVNYLILQFLIICNIKGDSLSILI